MSELTVPKGIIVKIGGLPFELLQNTKVSGNSANLQSALTRESFDPAWRYTLPEADRPTEDAKRAVEASHTNKGEG